jgi:hypothetical protein
VADQRGWKTMAIMWVWRFLHSSILAQDRAARQTGYCDNAIPSPDPVA